MVVVVVVVAGVEMFFLVAVGSESAYMSLCLAQAEGGARAAEPRIEREAGGGEDRLRILPSTVFPLNSGIRKEEYQQLQPRPKQ